jgi:hypothetical protein
VIHFEQVLGLIFPDDSIDEARPARSRRNNPYLANKSRLEAITAIENVKSVTELQFLMAYPHILYNSWSFHNIMKREICLIRPLGCDTAEDAIKWIEFAKSFVRASIDSPNISRLLEKYPPNFQGLAGFLSQKLLQPGYGVAYSATRLARLRSTDTRLPTLSQNPTKTPEPKLPSGMRKSDHNVPLSEMVTLDDLTDESLGWQPRLPGIPPPLQ